MQYLINSFISLTLLAATGAAIAQTPAPTLQVPSNGQSNWLYNAGANFQWLAITGANYRIVISDQADFSNYNEAASACRNAGCITFASTNAFASRSNLANYWFYGSGTYYWKVRASTNRGGTSAWSRTFSFTTTSAGLRTVALAAVGNVGGNSPQSLVDTKTIPTWATDMAEGDGDRHRTALGRLHTHARSIGYTTWVRGGRAVPSRARSAMVNDLSTYGRNASQIVDRMITVYANSVPTSDRDMLSLLSYRAQCKEFADRMVSQGGLTPRSYSYTSGTSVYPRPGFYVFNRGNHAGIARAVSYSAQGIPQVQMVEANWGDGWSNPGGQVPWQRTVRGDRSLTINGRPYVTVDPS